jgi:hypothetical protein
MRRAGLVLGVVILGFLGYAYFSTRWSPDAERPIVAQAIEDGRQAAYVVFTGRFHGRSYLVWSASAGERVKATKELFVDPFEFKSLAEEVGWLAAGPLMAEDSQVELVALDVRGSTVVATYKLADLDGNPVRTPEHGPLLASVALRYAAPRSEESWVTRLGDRLFSWDKIATTPMLRNLGRRRGYWWVLDFASTATLNDYHAWILREKATLAGQAQGLDAEQMRRDLLDFAVREPSEEAIEKLVQDELVWVRKMFAEQTGRFVQVGQE